MKEYIKQFVNEYDCPEECGAVLLSAYDRLSEYEEFNSLVDEYYIDNKIPIFRDVIEKLSKKIGIHEFTGYGVLFVCISKQTKEVCRKWNWDDDMFRRGMLDIKYHFLECFECHKVWGVPAPGWITGIVTGGVVSLGRMQFLIKTYNGENVKIGEHILEKGTKYIDAHIPGSGEPFDENARMDAYEKAYKYFGNVSGDGPCFFGCESWLLFPPNKEILDPESNIVSFMNEFTVVKETIFEESEILRDAWRVFGYVEDGTPYENLPEKSSLQRAYKKWLLDGNLLGMGMGFKVYQH